MLLMDMERARRVMQQKGVDALVAITLQNTYYTSGHHINLDWLPAATVTPADPAFQPVMLTNEFDEESARRESHIKDIWSYPVWIQIVEEEDLIQGKATRIAKPQQFDKKIFYALLSDIFKEKKLDRGIIGVEIGALTHDDYSLLIEHIPEAKFIDAAGMFFDLRSIKSNGEIEALKIAASMAVKGIQGMIEGGVLGTTIGELHLKYKKSVVQEITKDNLGFRFDHTLLSAGDLFSTSNSPEYKVANGDVIFIDCGVVVKNYSSDMGRTFIVGKPSPLQEKIYNALRAGYEESLSRIRPGVKMKEIYHAGQEVIRRHGLEWYTRGHLGHTIGLAPPEQPPFISGDEERELEPNMVICLETPLYVRRHGAYQIEDMMLITTKGYEILTELTRDMVEL
jgi:Xaa-Pro dipeptidase